MAVISLQVIQEYFVTVTRKLGVDPALAQTKVELLTRGRVVRFESGYVVVAIELHRQTRISFWDALIVQAARLAGAAVLYSEDFQHGSSLGGIPIVNPFLPAGKTVFMTRSNRNPGESDLPNASNGDRRKRRTLTNTRRQTKLARL